MAQRRMFSKTVIDTDKFGDLPKDAQLLYFYLGMDADDDGFVARPKQVMRTRGANDDDLKLLIAKGFVIAFDQGVIVITDWRANNWIRSDRYVPTSYGYEKRQLIQDENGRYYSLAQPDQIDLATRRGVALYPLTSVSESGTVANIKLDKGHPELWPEPLLSADFKPIKIDDNHMVYQVDTQYRLGKGSLGKVRLGQDSSVQGSSEQKRKGQTNKKEKSKEREGKQGHGGENPSAGAPREAVQKVEASPYSDEQIRELLRQSNYSITRVVGRLVGNGIDITQPLGEQIRLLAAEWESKQHV
ncbi:hypothetical protein [Lacticaseibacillus songhuajiangensis]|uniref:hypothetical protein n=1 Tax=Lacticaseibacillus songhuajiangensis TaxID=1296539 RepID=UPI000F7B2006|nr:hypothetical protein [Lacticaseibacillus songhuajiangensis]